MNLTDAQRAARAKEAIENPVLTEAISLINAAYLKALRDCAPKDDLGRYRYAVALDVVDAVQTHLKRTCDLGTFEQAQEINPRRKVFPLF